MSVGADGRWPGGPTRRQVIVGIGAMAGAGLAPSAVAAARKAARHRPHPSYPDRIGRSWVHVTSADDTLIELAPRFRLGFTELVAANQGVDPWVPGAGVKLLIPGAHLLPAAPRIGLVINLADQRLYLFRRATGTIDTAPIGIGSTGWNTPTGRTRVVRKRVKPTWYVPKSIRKEQPELPAVVPPGPDNPLGDFAIDLGWQSYVIHGTNEPLGVGRRVSHGCVRLYPNDVERIFKRVPIGLRVTVVDQPVKTGWMAGRLLLEVHPSQKQADELEKFGKFGPETPADFKHRIIEAAGKAAPRLNWPAIDRAVDERRGAPIDILLPEPASSG